MAYLNKPIIFLFMFIIGCIIFYGFIGLIVFFFKLMRSDARYNKKKVNFWPYVFLVTGTAVVVLLVITMVASNSVLRAIAGVSGTICGFTFVASFICGGLDI